MVPLPFPQASTLFSSENQPHFITESAIFSCPVSHFSSNPLSLFSTAPTPSSLYLFFFNANWFLSPKKMTAWILFFSSVNRVCLPSFSFLFLLKKFRFSSVSSPKIQIHSASPKMLCQSSPCLLLIARKMIFLPLNHAAALSPSSLNVDSLSIYIHPGPFFSFFIFFFKRGLNISQSQPPSFLF